MTAALFAGLPMSLCPGLTAKGYGTVVLTHQYPSRDEHCEAVSVTVDHADPRIVVSTDFLHRVSRGDEQCPVVGVRLVVRDRYDFTGSLLHIDADDQHLVYRIGAYRWEEDVWEAAWPD